MEDDPDEEDMDNVNLDDERECHWRMVFEDNNGGVEDAKALLHAKRWDVYANEKGKIVKGGYSMEFFGHDKKKVLWEVVDDNIAEAPTDHEEIGLQGFDLYEVCLSEIIYFLLFYFKTILTPFPPL